MLVCLLFQTLGCVIFQTERLFKLETLKITHIKFHFFKIWPPLNNVFFQFHPFSFAWVVPSQENCVSVPLFLCWPAADGLTQMDFCSRLPAGNLSICQTCKG